MLPNHINQDVSHLVRKGNWWVVYLNESSLWFKQTAVCVQRHWIHVTHMFHWSTKLATAPPPWLSCTVEESISPCRPYIRDGDYINLWQPIGNCVTDWVKGPGGKGGPSRETWNGEEKDSNGVYEGDLATF